MLIDILVTDSAGNARLESRSVTVIDPNDTTLPIVALTAPLADAEITAPVSVIGSINDAQLQRWQLLISPARQQQWRKIASGTTNVSNAVLGTFDPTLLTNGLWDLNLLATDAGGNSASEVIHLLVTGTLKVGNFSFTELRRPQRQHAHLHRQRDYSQRRPERLVQP